MQNNPPTKLESNIQYGLVVKKMDYVFSQFTLQWRLLLLTD